jgi:hypothetical protein
MLKMSSMNPPILLTIISRPEYPKWRDRRGPVCVWDFGEWRDKGGVDDELVNGSD